MKDQLNDKTNEYGEGLENSCRFTQKATEATVNEIGADRVGIMLSPFDECIEVVDSDPEALEVHMAN